MCFDHDSRPPIVPIAGGALDSRELTLTAADGNRLTAFEARAADPIDASIVILPDVRGLHEYYVELAMRFAEAGIDAVAFDWFGRTAGLGRRAEGFDYTTEVGEAHMGRHGGRHPGRRRTRPVVRAERGAFTIGFCMGGRASFLAASLGLGLAGVIGFYGSPVGPGRGGSPQPVDVVGDHARPRPRSLRRGRREHPANGDRGLRRSLDAAGIEHDLRSYEGAPHSFFDRKADQFADASADAWDRVLAFVRAGTA